VHVADENTKRVSLGHGVAVFAGIVALMGAVVVAAPHARRVLVGEQPGPLLKSLQREPVVTLAPSALVFRTQQARAGSGSVAVTRNYSYSGAPEPEMVFGYYRGALPSFGWSLTSPAPSGSAGREVYFKTIAGKDVRYVVAADAGGASTEIWLLYDTGLIGG
jgi:hypothetical protein